MDMAGAFAHLVQGRHSCRKFTGRQVARKTIEDILRIAQHTASWCNSQPWQIIVTQGDEVSLEFIGINGAEHPTTIVGYDKTLVLKRGHVVKLEFTADKAGTFPIICAHHKPSMVAELIVLPKR